MTDLLAQLLWDRFCPAGPLIGLSHEPPLEWHTDFLIQASLMLKKRLLSDNSMDLPSRFNLYKGLLLSSSSAVARRERGEAQGRWPPWDLTGIHRPRACARALILELDSHASDQAILAEHGTGRYQSFPWRDEASPASDPIWSVRKRLTRTFTG